MKQILLLLLFVCVSNAQASETFYATLNLQVQYKNENRTIQQVIECKPVTTRNHVLKFERTAYRMTMKNARAFGAKFSDGSAFVGMTPEICPYWYPGKNKKTHQKVFKDEYPFVAWTRDVSNPFELLAYSSLRAFDSPFAPVKVQKFWVDFSGERKSVTPFSEFQWFAPARYYDPFSKKEVELDHIKYHAFFALYLNQRREEVLSKSNGREQFYNEVREYYAHKKTTHYVKNIPDRLMRLTFATPNPTYDLFVGNTIKHSNSLDYIDAVPFSLLKAERKRRAEPKCWPRLRFTNYFENK